MSNFILLITLLGLAGIRIIIGNPVTPRILCKGRKNKTESGICCDIRNRMLTKHQSKEDAVRIVNQMNIANVTTVWLERHRIELGCFKWTNGTKFKERSQNQLSTSDSCGAVDNVTQQLEVHHCSQRNFGFICEHKDCESCASLGLFRGHCRLLSGVCYVYFCGIDNWYAARAKCHRYGMEFATIPNNETLSALLSLTGFDVCPKAWIGLRTTEWNRAGSHDLLAHWGPDEPSGIGDCVVAHKTLKRHLRWKVSSCNSRHSYICMDYLKERTTESTSKAKRNGAISLPDIRWISFLFVFFIIFVYTLKTSNMMRKMIMKQLASMNNHHEDERKSLKPPGDGKSVKESELKTRMAEVEGAKESYQVYLFLPLLKGELEEIGRDLGRQEDAMPTVDLHEEQAQSLKVQFPMGRVQSGNVHSGVEMGDHEEPLDFSEETLPNYETFEMIMKQLASMNNHHDDERKSLKPPGDGKSVKESEVTAAEKGCCEGAGGGSGPPSVKDTKEDELKMRRLTQEMLGQITIQPSMLSLMIHEGIFESPDQQMVRQIRHTKEDELKMRRLEQQIQGQITMQPFVRSLSEESKMRRLEQQMRGKIPDKKEPEEWCM